MSYAAGELHFAGLDAPQVRLHALALKELCPSLEGFPTATARVAFPGRLQREIGEALDVAGAKRWAPEDEFPAQ